MLESSPVRSYYRSLLRNYENRFGEHGYSLVRAAKKHIVLKKALQTAVGLFLCFILRQISTLVLGYELLVEALGPPEHKTLYSNGQNRD